MANTPSTPSISSRPWMSTKLKIVLVVGIVMFLLHQLVVNRIDAKLRDALTEWEGDQSLSISTYLPPPELPADAINATDYLEAAGLVAEGQGQVYAAGQSNTRADLGDLHQRFRRLEADRSRPGLEDLSTFREMVARYALTLDVLGQGLDTATAARYVTDYAVAPHAIVVPNLLLRLRLGSLIRARGEIAIAEGRDADGWRDAVRMYQLAHWTTDDAPTLINALVARAIAHHAGLLTQALLSEAPGTAGDRAPVGDWANRVDVVHAVNHMLAAERAVALAQVRDPDAAWHDAQPASLGTSIARWLDDWGPWSTLNAALYLDAASPVFAACATPTHQLTADQHDRSVVRPPSWAAPARQALFECFDVGHKRDLWLADQHHVTLALALEEIREATGGYPETVTDPPIDPFSGEPHRYRRTPDGYVLYSVSVNGRDDGGTPPPPGKTGFPQFAEGDLVWRVTSRG